MKKTRNLITGGSGFIGSNLSLFLLKKDEQVTCLDNYISGCKKNLIDCYKFSNFELIEHDVTEPINLKADKIWHLACPASPIHYQQNPINTSRTIFLGTYNMLELAKNIGAKFLLASTSEIYGDPQEHPQREQYRGSVNTTGIRSCYDEGKRIAETLCSDFNRSYSLDVKIVRIFNTYGPNMRFDDGRVISNFITQALRNRKITIYGNGHQTRSFCHIDDLIHGMNLLMDSNFNDPINIGNSKELSIIELANLIKKLINPTLQYEFQKSPEDDPQKRKPCLKLAKKILSWEPNIELEQGLIKTIDWFKDNI